MNKSLSLSLSVALAFALMLSAGPVGYAQARSTVAAPVVIASAADDRMVAAAGVEGEEDRAVATEAEVSGPSDAAAASSASAETAADESTPLVVDISVDLVRQEHAARVGAPFAACLTDCHMPEMDGFSLVERIRADAQLQDTIVLMLTSGMKPEDTHRVSELGITMRRRGGN